MLLLVISQQLSNSSTSPAGQFVESNFLATRSDVQINVLYFVSLVLALSVSSVCILGKQWIREYQRDIAVSACDSLRIRQARFDALHRWRVPQILSILPVILQAALLLFFAGLLTQLWNVANHTVAIVVSILIGLTLLMVAITTIVPAHWKFQRSDKRFTPFRSPQAWIYLECHHQIRVLLQMLRSQLLWRLYTLFPTSPFFRKLHVSALRRDRHARSWADLDTKYLAGEGRHHQQMAMLSVRNALRWVVAELRSGVEIEQAVYWCLQKGHQIDTSQEKGQALLSEPTASDGLSIEEFYYSLTRDMNMRKPGHYPDSFQAELLLRSCNRLIDLLRQKPDSVLELIRRRCYLLSQYLPLFHKESDYDYQEGELLFSSMPIVLTDATSVDTDSTVIYDQISLMLQRLFRALQDISPSHISSEFSGLVELLLAMRVTANPTSTTPLQKQSITKSFLDIFQKHRSISLMLSAMASTCSIIRGMQYWADGLDFFVSLDRRMVEMLKSVGGDAPRLDGNLLQEWHELRMQVIEHSKQVSDTDPLPDDYFDKLHV